MHAKRCTVSDIQRHLKPAGAKYLLINQHRLKSKPTLGVFRQSPVDEAWLRHLFDRPSGKRVRCTAESRVTGTLVRQAVREWTRDQEAAFRNIGRLLKEDGECLLLFSAPFFLYDIWLEMAGLERWKGILGDPKELFPDIWHRDPSPSLSDLETSLRKLIVDAGMTTLTCEVYSTEAYYRSLEDVLAVLVPIVFVKSGTSEEETSSIRSELSSRLMKRFKMTPRGCSVTVNLFLFHTQKVIRDAPTDV
ncbi:hypothetical protein HPB47_017365 [Ixodes persulcatus]|uniref:Uncharacterized protein n=1 Tax=Ixodes persulcatus TaxID=34615 RepID=A0AC60QNG8_IXOPE|nr:hypothetical protein HPB47_017365 [Ixodes persulcatus]